ncbi:SurA N-terminal domain-containing protein [Methylocapsa sp. S129]|uniref:SurA N-terminal domain-containing protein n=1 Tax=Methylocapsa sp. S129 TaxID=1641869 RepID=UPI00131CA72D|nr:SurA N-terminal domain-containing protein [Methylocapsa sp. S129]
MLDRMRAATQGFIGRAIMTIVLGLIVVAFAVFGIGDVFRGFGSNKIASVGGAPIAPDDFRNAYQAIMQQYQRQAKTGLTNAQAHAMGLDVQTLGRLIADKALDVQAHSLGLAISDETIADAIRNDPRLKDASGAFSADRFEGVLRDAGLSERGFIAEQRNTDLRQQIGVSLVNGVTAPKALVEALARFDTQSRNVDYLTLPPAAAGDIAPPTPDALQSFFDARKESYRAPEYRAVNILAVTPTSLAKPGEVTDEDARALYDKVKDARFGAPEKRKLQQIVFPNEAEANEALAKIKAGTSFDDIAKARNLTDKDIDLGDVTRLGVFDKAIADAGFALAPDSVSDVVKGQFGPAIIRVTQITPANLKPYDEVAAQLKQEIAVERAANDALNVHDKIEDARVSGKSLGEAGKTVGVEERAIAAIDANGLDKNGVAVEGLDEKAALLHAIFASDVGVDDQPLATKDRGFVWFEVTKVEPPRARSLDEVKDQATKQWRDDQVAKALSAKSADMVQKLNAGATLASLAEAEKLETKSATDIHRRGGGGLDESVVAAIFNTSSAGAGSAATPAGRVVFKVTADSTPPIDPADPKVKALQSSVNEGLTDDLVSQYIAELQRQLGVVINDNALQAAEGS